MTSSPQLSPPRSSRRSKVGLLAVGIGCVLVVGAGAGFFLFKGSSSPAEVSDRFVTAMQKGDTDKAFDLTGKNFRKKTNKAGLERVAAEVEPFLDGRRRTITERVDSKEGRPSVAIFVYEIDRRGNAPFHYMKTQVVKEGDVWRVVSFRTDTQRLDDGLD